MVQQLLGCVGYWKGSPRLAVSRLLDLFLRLQLDNWSLNCPARFLLGLSSQWITPAPAHPARLQSWKL